MLEEGYPVKEEVASMATCKDVCGKECVWYGNYF